MKKYTLLLVVLILLFSFGLSYQNVFAATISVKLSTVKDLTDTMLKGLNAAATTGQGCANNFALTNCTYQYVNYDGIHTSDDSAVPALWTGVYNSGAQTTSSNSESSGPVYYSLSDPLNPVLKADSSYPNAYMDRRTLFHAYASLIGVSYSNDGEYSIIGQGEGYDLIFKGADRYYGTLSFRNGDVKIVQFNGYTIAISDSGSAKNLTDITGTYLKMYSGSEDGRDTYAKNPDSIPLPPNFPKLYSGLKLSLSDQKYLVSFDGFNATLDCTMTPVPSNCYTTGKRLAVYDLTQKNPVATLTLPSSFGPQGGIGNIKLTRTSIDGIDYIYLSYPTSFAAMGGTTPDKLFVYKFDSATKKLTTVANGLALVSGENNMAFAGIRINNNPGVVVFSNKRTNPVSETAAKYDVEVRVYMNSDLQAGKMIDALGGSVVNPVKDTHEGTGSRPALAAYSTDTSAYLYYFTGGGTYALKFDEGTNSSINTNSPGCTSSGPYNVLTGELCATDPGCTSAGPYSSTTGKLCSVYTTPPTGSSSSEAKTKLQNGCAVGDIISTITGKACSSN